MNAKNFLIRTILASALAVALPLAAQPHEPRVGDTVASFEMTWTPSTSGRIAERAQGIAHALFGAAAGPVEAHPLSTPEGVVRRWEISIPGAPSWQMRYIPDYDEFRAIDLGSIYAATASGDVGEAAARDIALAAFHHLSEAGALDERQFDWGGAEVASTWILKGSVAGAAFDRTRADYRFTVRRSINGIELANAGLRIAVDVSGRLSELRLGGVSVASQIGTDRVERPIGLGTWLTRQVESDSLLQRFYRDAVPTYATADVAWARVMYAMPDETHAGATVVVEPRYVVSYTLKTSSEAGPISSRRLVLAYSITDPAASPLDLAPPARDPRPDPEPKPETAE